MACIVAESWFSGDLGNSSGLENFYGFCNLSNAQSEAGRRKKECQK